MLVAFHSNVESIDKTPELVEAYQPAVNCNPGFSGVVMGVTVTALAGGANPLGFDSDV
jgi:hypothetical protein